MNSRAFYWALILGFLLLAGGTLKGQAPVPAASTSVTAPQPSVIESMKRTVVFLQSDCVEQDAQGKQVLKNYSGTAFLLSLADARLKDRAFTYLVTNRHVAQPGVEDGHPCQPVAYLLRADAKVPDSSGSYSTVTQLSPTGLAWTFPTDPSVDLAIAPISVNAEKLDVVFLPTSLLLDDAATRQSNVQEGDSVLFTGLFIQMVGQAHSEPIVREGKIAMMPREKIPTTLRDLGDVYLVDCHVFGGNSGSPMFIDLAGSRNGNLTVGVNYRLLGVVSGYVEEAANFELQTVAAYAGTIKANSGIAVVVPAQKVLDLLDSPGLKALREQSISSILKQSAP